MCPRWARESGSATHQSGRDKKREREREREKKTEDSKVKRVLVW